VVKYKAAVGDNNGGAGRDIESRTSRPTKDNVITEHAA